ncbi:MAG: GWxTD domain-containing protein, partial [Acidobacteria bacterium]
MTQSSFSTGLLLCLLVALPTGEASLYGGAPLQQNQEEALDYYKKWLEEDVVYIITAEERDVFLKLQGDAERDTFIEQFWRRRDPDPATAVNELKEEHYRRIQYANERFAAGLAGWKTDRGRVYIKFGPPDDIQDYPAGSTYVRPQHEGGGTTLVHPFQVWTYNHIEGVGTNIEIEFVDPRGGNLYRFARDAQEKDSLLHLPLGFTTAEKLIGGDKSERIITRQLGDVDEQTDALSGHTVRSSDAPMERLVRQGEIEAAPAFNFDDLKKIVTARVQYSNLGFESDYSVLRYAENRALVPVSVWIKDSELTFEQLQSGLQRATIELYGSVTTLGNRLLYEFTDKLVREKNSVSVTGKSAAHKTLTLDPGRYKLALVVRDVTSGKIGTRESAVIVPQVSNRLSSSSLMLAHDIRPASGREVPGSLVLSGKYRLLPNTSRSVRRPEA